MEEQLRKDRIIKAFHKKKKWLNVRAQMEDEQIKSMARKFDEDLRLHFQEEVQRQQLRAAQELCKEEERKLEEVVKKLSAEHGVREEDIRIQMQAVQDIVRDEVEKKLEKERKDEEEKKRTEQMVREREQQKWEENSAEEEQLALQVLYNRKQEIEMEIGVEEADAMAWEEEVERRFEDQMSLV